MIEQDARPLMMYRDLLILGLLVSFFYGVGLGYYPFFTPDEGRYSEIAREMVVTHDYLTPRMNGIPFFDKPILYYWLQAFSIHLFGVKEWALRLFPMLAGLVLTLSTYVFARTMLDRRAALLSAGILATSPMVFAMAHYANLDLEVACFITLSLYCGMVALYRVPTSSTALYASAAFAGLAVLTKGLIGVFFPAMILGVMFLFLRRFQFTLIKQVVIAAILFCAIVFPWFIAMEIKHPQFFHYFFVTQHITRFLSQGEFNNKTPIWFYLPVIAIGFFPWSVFLYHALKHTLLQAWRAQEKRALAVFLLLFAAVVFVFFSMPHSKIVSYILPVFPPLALMVGWYLSAHWDALLEYKRSVYVLCGVVIAMILLLMSLPFIAPQVNTQSAKSIAQTLKPLLSTDSQVITYYDYFYDLPLYSEHTVKIVADWNDPTVMQRDNWRREFALGAPFEWQAQSILLTANVFWQQWQAKSPVFVVMSISDFQSFQQQTTHYRVLKKTSDMVLLTNQ